MLADALGHELVVRTSADLVSKYVGETERNLTALFNGLGAASLRPQAALPPARAGPASRPVCPRSAGREHPGDTIPPLLARTLLSLKQLTPGDFANVLR